MQSRKIIKAKKRVTIDKASLPEGEEGGIVYSDDEFEEEIIHERDNDEYDDENEEGDAWEDVDSDKASEEEMRDVADIT